MNDLAARALAIGAKAIAKDAETKARDAAHRARLYEENPDLVAFFKGAKEAFGVTKPSFLIDRTTGKSWGRQA